MDNGVNFSQNTIFCIFTSYRIDIRVQLVNQVRPVLFTDYL